MYLLQDKAVGSNLPGEVIFRSLYSQQLQTYTQDAMRRVVATQKTL